MASLATCSVQWSRHHDVLLLWESNILGQLQQLYMHDGRPFTVYGDPAYPTREHLISPIEKHILTDQEPRFNTSLIIVRECVECGFNNIASNFAFVDFRKKNLKVLLQSVGMYYIVATLLTNRTCCVYGNQTASFYNLSPQPPPPPPPPPPPTLEQYLRNQE